MTSKQICDLLVSKCPKHFLSFLKFALNSIKRKHFDKFYQLKKFVTMHIQIRQDRDYMGKENTTIWLMVWKIIMFDQNDLKSFNSLFTCQI